eukprot:TCALIF_01478-PA protein Name:"Protein of unknown function" AED:0.84 eAED:0.84 QI:0/0/0/0.25/1/1/4/0/158
MPAALNLKDMGLLRGTLREFRVGEVGCISSAKDGNMEHNTQSLELKSSIIIMVTRVKEDKFNFARSFLDSFNFEDRVRSLRGPPPLMEMSPIILPLEQRALWRNVAPPQLRKRGPMDMGADVMPSSSTLTVPLKFTAASAVRLSFSEITTSGQPFMAP